MHNYNLMYAFLRWRFLLYALPILMHFVISGTALTRLRFDSFVPDIITPLVSWFLSQLIH